MKKKILSAALAAMMFAMSLSSTAFADTTTDDEELINVLMDQRDKINTTAILNSELGLDISDLEKDIDRIDVQLAALGVESLTPAEVQEHFGNSDIIVPYIATPVSNSVNWTSKLSYMTVDGVTYEIQTLTATPKASVSSNLRETKTLVMQTEKEWQAAALAMLKVKCNKTVALVANSNPVTSFLKTLYDYGKAFVQSLSTTTTVTDVVASYTYAAATTVSFKFVKEKGQSDSNQELTYISTKCEIAVSDSLPTFVESNGATHPNIVSFTDNLKATPNGYDNNTHAVNGYIDPSYTPISAYVGSIDIYGLEGQKISTVSTICPTYIAQIQ